MTNEKETTRLSPSIAKTLLTKSPAHAWLEHRLLGARPREPRKSMDDGSMLHAVLLDQADDLVVIDASDYRKKAAQEARDAAHKSGKTPVLQHQLDDLVEAASEIKHQFDAFNISLCGASEVELKWNELLSDGRTVACSGRADHVILSAYSATIYELKKAESAHPDKCGRTSYDYGYDLQWAAYTSAIAKRYPDLAGRIDFVYVFIEAEAPYSVTPLRPNGEMRQLGLMRWERAVETWERCLRLNDWPGYVTEIGTFGPPPWAMAKELGSAA